MAKLKKIKIMAQVNTEAPDHFAASMAENLAPLREETDDGPDGDALRTAAGEYARALLAHGEADRARDAAQAALEASVKRVGQARIALDAAGRKVSVLGGVA